MDAPQCPCDVAIAAVISESPGIGGTNLKELEQAVLLPIALARRRHICATPSVGRWMEIGFLPAVSFSTLAYDA